MLQHFGYFQTSKVLVQDLWASVPKWKLSKSFLPALVLVNEFLVASCWFK